MRENADRGVPCDKEPLVGREKTGTAIAAFPSAAAADRLIAGVAAAARVVRKLADNDAASITLKIGDGAPLGDATRADIERLRGAVDVRIEAGPGPEVPLPTAWEVVRRTGKPGDGLVSRWLNRPISQRITFLILAIRGIRPIHVTIFNALLAVPMFLLLLSGGHTGLILGAVLFQAASILDGVDGEMARATFRTSVEGATLDSLIDMSINFLFVLGLTIHLAMRDHDLIGWIGAWAIVAMIVGNALIARRVRAQGAPLGFDLFKRRNARIGGVVDLIYWVVQVISARDFFAFLFMLLTLAGLERTALCIFAGVAVIWFFYVVIASLLSAPRSYRGAA
jgi:phosphatidylglycerophosphate synthase